MGLATVPEIERTPEEVRPLIGVVFNQQKLYISNLHLYSNAPAQGTLTLSSGLILTRYSATYGATQNYKRL